MTENDRKRFAKFLLKRVKFEVKMVEIYVKILK